MRILKITRLGMSLFDLSNELLLSVAEHLETEKDLNAFVQTSRHLYHLLNIHLYRGNIRQRGSSALLWAAKHGRETTVQKLLDEGANVQAMTDDGRTSLSLAAGNGHEGMVKLLLGNDGVDPDSKDNIERTPLSWAAGNGHEGVVKLLLANDGVDPNSENNLGWTPLSWAVKKGCEAVVELLLAKEGVDPDYRGDDRTPLS
ncbi:ankyrin repeat-containing domain protein [Macrophomina phaseolina]|uniref:Ankyrin repeat-containing domain protein n=1 Tax=Macrophomina phaseolina TaxID=35725 RepID=A0ABQ8GEV1_9PEZI|nr:ankyrin repeat-containing domain protein [Macrophomina phaseolina]